jgi:hypothetical protein
MSKVVFDFSNCSVDSRRWQKQILTLFTAIRGRRPGGRWASFVCCCVCVATPNARGEFHQTSLCDPGLRSIARMPRPRIISTHKGIVLYEPRNQSHNSHFARKVFPLPLYGERLICKLKLCHWIRIGGDGKWLRKIDVGSSGSLFVGRRVPRTPLRLDAAPRKLAAVVLQTSFAAAGVRVSFPVPFLGVQIPNINPVFSHIGVVRENVLTESYGTRQESRDIPETSCG